MRKNVNLSELLGAKLRAKFGKRFAVTTEDIRVDRSLRWAAIAMVVFSAVFFIRDGLSFYATVDFSSRDLGKSNIPDFFVFYSAARFLWDGGSIFDIYDFSALKAFQVSLGAMEHGLHPFNYPPTYLFLIWPLGVLPYPVALIGWQAFNITVLIAALRVAGLRRAEIFAATVAPATVLNFAAGQNGCITSALLISGLVLLARPHRDREAGCLFGLLTIKPHLGLLVPLVCLARRRWQAIVSAAGVTVALVGISILVFGKPSWAAYLDYLIKFQGQIQAQVSSDFLKYSATVLMAEQFLGIPKGFAYAIQIAISAAVGTVVYLAHRWPVNENQRLVVVLVGVSLVTPFGFVYDLPFLAVATVLMTGEGLRTGFMPLEAFWLAAAWLMPFLNVFSMERGIPVAPWLHLILFCYVVARILQTSLRPVPTPQPVTADGTNAGA